MALTQVNAQMISGALTTNSSGQISIGSTTLNSNLSVYGSGSGTFGAYNDPLVVQGSSYTLQYLKGTNGVAASIYSYNSTNGWYTGTNNSAAYRIGYMSSIDQTGVSNAKDGSTGITIDTSGNVMIGQTTANGRLSILGANVDWNYNSAVTGGASTKLHIRFLGDAVVAGTVTSSGSSTTYGTSSDYRLKENVAPMQNALNTVSQLNPVTYKWKADGKDGQGFIAHELQAIVPDCVVGEKDAVDKDGNPEYQCIDTSFLVATLTAAIQELKAEVDQLKAQLAPK